MKKWMGLALGIAVMMFLSGCGAVDLPVESTVGSEGEWQETAGVNTLETETSETEETEMSTEVNTEATGAEGERDLLIEIPEFATKTGVSVGTYNCGDGDSEIAYEQVTYDEVVAYREGLETAGFELYAENRIGGNDYTTYVSDASVVRVSWYSEKELCRIVYGPKGYLPETENPKYTKVVDPTITQIARVGAKNGAPGLSLILQLEDGSFVVIDGGGNSNGLDEKTLLEFLQEHNPTEDKPRVTWMFTHAHSDHMVCAIMFMGKYADQINLERVYCNFPDYTTLEVVKESTEESQMLVQQLKAVLERKYPKTEICVFHGGDKLLMPGCEIDILLTHEDFWPNEFRHINHTSSVWRMKLQGRIILILGDSVETENAYLAELYGDELKCDILQTAHHGYNGGCMELYQAADPEICFWSTDQDRFETDEIILGIKKGYEFNAWLRNPTIKERMHYTASETAMISLLEMRRVEEMEDELHGTSGQ
ncbi:MAG: hypothetical protein IJZ85_01220 [Lachnospiraceae bacterium]|nr:hypothetical protein [Lachnospiraceae bacterium]